MLIVFVVNQALNYFCPQIPHEPEELFGVTL